VQQIDYTKHEAPASDHTRNKSRVVGNPNVLLKSISLTQTDSKIKSSKQTTKLGMSNLGIILPMTHTTIKVKLDHGLRHTRLTRLSISNITSLSLPLQMTSTIGRQTRVDSFAMLAHSLEANVLTVHNFADLVQIIPDIRGARVLPLGAGGHDVGLRTSTIRSTRAITVTIIAARLIGKVLLRPNRAS
jgi:hypothetical protein